jgi:hypothetical protein
MELRTALEDAYPIKDGPAVDARREVESERIENAPCGLLQKTGQNVDAGRGIHY